MKKLFECLLSKPVLICLVIGIILSVMSVPDMIVSFKGAVNFEELLEEDVENGDHIEGEIVLSFGAFASEDTVRTNRNGSTSTSKNTAFYYVVPGTDDVYYGIKILKDDSDDILKISNQTLDWLNGGSEPTATLEFEGRVSKMDDDLAGLYEEWLLEFGYTQSEIDDMGEFYVIEPRNFMAVRIMAFGGIILIIVAVVLILRKYKKLSQQEINMTGGYQGGYTQPEGGYDMNSYGQPQNQETFGFGENTSNVENNNTDNNNTL